MVRINAVLEKNKELQRHADPASGLSNFAEFMPDTQGRLSVDEAIGVSVDAAQQRVTIRMPGRATDGLHRLSESHGRGSAGAPAPER